MGQKSRKRRQRQKQQKRKVSSRTIGNQEPEEVRVVNVRRWENAETNRLNACHWAYAHGNSINEDLDNDLETLRARAHYEACNNPIVEGVIRTHQCDIVGERGPRLQVQSDDAQFNEAVELGWQSVYDRPDPTGRLNGPELIKLWVAMLWKAGSYVNEEVTYQRTGSVIDQAVTLGIRTYHPRRLETPPKFNGDPNVAFGQRLTKDGRPTQYYIRSRENRGTGIHDAPFRYKYRTVPADMVQHVYEMAEPDQLIGYPWVSSSLGVLADIRKNDQYVMEASKNAAANALYWWSNHPDAEFVDRDGEEQILEPGTAKFIGGGYQPAMLQPTQPSAEYQQWRHEKMRELGRPVCMPLMVVLLSSADSNFASAHYDGQVYMRSLKAIQSWIERRSLNDYVRKVARELALSRIVSIPQTYTLDWTWDVPPYHNPKQMYDSFRARLEDGTAAYGDVLAAYGLDEDTTIEKRRRTAEKLEAAGLPELPVNAGSQAKQSDDEETQTQQTAGTK